MGKRKKVFCSKILLFYEVCKVLVLTVKEKSTIKD